MRITWKEFKKIVDKQLKEKSISEDKIIWVIDIHYPEKDDFEKERIDLSSNKDHGIYIW